MDSPLDLIIRFLMVVIGGGFCIYIGIKVEKIVANGKSKFEKNLSMYIIVTLVIITILSGIFL